MTLLLGVEEERALRTALEAKAKRIELEDEVERHLCCMVDGILSLWWQELQQLLSTTRDDIDMLHARIDEMQKRLDASLKAEEEER